MKKKGGRRVFIGFALLLLGLVLILLPLHIAMTGLTAAGYGFLCLADWFTERRGWRRGWHTVIVAVGVAVGAVLVSATAAVLLLGRSDWERAEKADYIVVLGAQTHGGQPSRTLRARLDMALVLMGRNPDAVVIVSGGKGSDEDFPEALVMYNYMTSRGADSSRLYQEPKSHNTRENLIFSAEIASQLGLDPDGAAIVTSEFHLCRAKYIAGTLGFETVGVASRTTPKVLMLNYALREVFAFVKAWFMA